MMKWEYGENGFWELEDQGKLILKIYAYGETTDGRRVDTREAVLKAARQTEKGLEFCFSGSEGVDLTEYLGVTEKGMAWAQCSISGRDGEMLESRLLAPLVVGAAEKKEGKTVTDLWKDLWMKMLSVPYDNTMWLRYEALPLRAGRKSYEVTALYSEETREGIVMGALDFELWKNGFVCSATDANTIEARSGMADEGTHDTVPHGAVIGEKITSSRFGILYGEDYRRLLEQYGDLLAGERAPLKWDYGVPFGFNSWAGLALRLNEKRYEESAEFMRKELMPQGYQNGGTTYINLDAGWNVMTGDRLAAQADRLHACGQKAGIYDAPFAFFGRDVTAEIPGAPGHRMEEILLRDERGRFLARVDRAIPYDLTHPLWKKMTEHKYKKFIKWNYDYVKMDFMSHGGMEGCHYDKTVVTGRQAINQGYAFLNELLDEERIGRPFFISLSIAPIFPYGYGHARRVSCDAFGTAQDVEYELNSQTYGWWLNGRLYQYNDPDHIVLFKSFGMTENSTEGEARARYTTAVIGGTVMMLSDDYEQPEARERALRFASNRKINAIAASQTVFTPAESAQSSASAWYTAKWNGKRYLAVFHWTKKKETVAVDLKRDGLDGGRGYIDLWSGREFQDDQGILLWEADGCDALLLEETEVEK